MNVSYRNRIFMEIRQNLQAEASSALDSSDLYSPLACAKLNRFIEKAKLARNKKTQLNPFLPIYYAMPKMKTRAYSTTRGAHRKPIYAPDLGAASA